MYTESNSKLIKKTVSEIIHWVQIHDVKAWISEFHPQVPHGKWRKRTDSYKFSSDLHSHWYMHKYKCKNKILIDRRLKRKIYKYGNIRRKHKQSSTRH